MLNQLIPIESSNLKSPRLDKRTEIHYAIAESSIGWVIVAATEIGICAIAIGESAEILIAEIVEMFPLDLINQTPIEQNKTYFSGEHLNLSQWLADVICLIEQPKTKTNLPLDIQGTQFQKQVWQALQTIPVGSTISYAELANQIGNPKAVRAVASACGSNKVAIAIPCHRVIGSDRKLTGYRWGIERKQILLERESVNLD
jgi:AraC family transcriptional regulator, regulatory protein of adaptative response / methylated-DNA-[protein]-cysteine methyltransferase